MFLRCALTTLLAVGIALAQGGRGGGGMGGDEGMGGGMGGRGGGENMGMGGGMPRAQRQTKAEILMDKLKLNHDQKEEALKILSETAQKASPIAQQINRGRQMVANAMLQKKSADEMKQLMEAYTKVCGQMTALEAEAFGKIYAGLKPNQQKNAAQQFEYMSGIFMPTLSAGGGRGMGRGQGQGNGGRQ